MSPQPKLVVFTMLFPHAGQPNAGIFIRERMFRVGQALPLVVVAPVPWFPGQAILRKWRPHFRPPTPSFEQQQGFAVYHPRFLSIPGLCKSLDGLFMALGSALTLWRLKRQFGFTLIDAHFAYPDGYAATLLGKWFRVPVTITLRGTEVRHSGQRRLRPLLLKALHRASRIFAVATALKRHAENLGIPGEKIKVIGNGVDLVKFRPIPQAQARSQLKLPLDVPIIVSVGGLVERKGFHRVIDCLPVLQQRFPDIHYLIVGGPSAEGDMTAALRQQVARLNLQNQVHFLGILPPDQLKIPLSAADVFVLATGNEGWANVFLEAMACGLPVVTTAVGGNAEVISRPELGYLIPFGDEAALTETIAAALTRSWERQAIIAYAHDNTWDKRVTTLIGEFNNIMAQVSPDDPVKI
ncbi:MAG: glycosyltransferase family 4 protein [Candidatus Competibacteraceae bacterium]